MARKRDANAEPPLGPPMTDAERAELDDRLARMLTKPVRSVVVGDRHFLLWSQRDDAGSARMMIWTPETDEEIRAANLFHDAAHALGDFAHTTKPGRPVRRSPEHDAFIRAILQRRDDETAWLAYADYLTERGDSQGDHIRLCVELSKLPPDGEEAANTNQRINDLCAAHAEDWFAPLGELGLRPEWHGHFIPWAWLSLKRGVIETVAIDRPGVLPQNAARLFAAAPFLRQLKFERGHLDPAGLAKVKQLPQIEELELHHTDLTAGGLRALLRSKHLTGLKSLDLGGNDIGDEGAAALAAWPGLVRLESLDVANCSLSHTGASALADSAGAMPLKRLSIGRNTDTAGVAGAVLTASGLQNLTELKLAGTEFDWATAGLFRVSPFARTLRRLDLDSSTIQPGAAGEIARIKLPALQVLKLNSVALRREDASALARASWRGTLTELFLDACALGPGGTEALVAGRFPRLEKLDLSRNALGTRGAVALAAAAKNFPALTSLRLWDDKLTPQAVARLAGSPGLARLTGLDLSGNRIGPAGAAALAKSKYLEKLTSLTVDEAAVGKSGKRALLDRFGEGFVTFG
jgi:uncharacterized protein (TIGR02996 family)